MLAWLMEMDCAWSKLDPRMCALLVGGATFCWLCKRLSLRPKMDTEKQVVWLEYHSLACLS